MTLFQAILVKTVLQSLSLLLSFCLKDIWKYRAVYESEFENCEEKGEWSLSSWSYALLIIVLLSFLVPPGLLWVMMAKVRWTFCLLDVPLLITPIVLIGLALNSINFFLFLIQ